MYVHSYSVREGICCVTKEFVSSIRKIEQAIRVYEDHELYADRIVWQNRRYWAILYIYMYYVYFEKKTGYLFAYLPRLGLRQYNGKKCRHIGVCVVA